MSTNPSHRLIGLDPGLRFTGWGVIDVTGPKLVHVANGSIASKQADPLPTRLLQIESGLEEVFDAWAPDHAGVEQTFVNRD
ncbi:MAG: crossover junction endodeoxyribonuclease RuvC, partial [Pseudomonadota bacterium]|nr:crossover junction endodeoxyribonuclease RuvC [Pseudomonadota bacterium]MEC8566252.1 crossover junction endodeoxyribonuclease RuvC [Pseudomonadota bacterium]